MIYPLWMIIYQIQTWLNNFSYKYLHSRKCLTSIVISSRQMSVVMMKTKKKMTEYVFSTISS